MSKWFEKKVYPKNIVYHVANRSVRDSILKDGLRPFAGNESGKWSFDSDSCYPPMIFANNSETIYDFFYFEDVHYFKNATFDIWEIDTCMISNDWYLDLNLYFNDKHICTPQAIPVNALVLREFGELYCPYCKDLDWGRSLDVMLQKNGKYIGMWCGDCNPEVDDLD